MSLDRSLRTTGGLSQHRSVLKRAERIGRMVGAKHDRAIDFALARRRQIRRAQMPVSLAQPKRPAIARLGLQLKAAAVRRR